MDNTFLIKGKYICLLLRFTQRLTNKRIEEVKCQSSVKFSLEREEWTEIAHCFNQGFESLYMQNYA